MTLATAVKILRIFLGVNFFWFGMLKFFSGASPAEGLALMTIDALGFGWIEAAIAIKLLAIWEVLIGLGFLSGIALKYAIRIFMVHMLLTFSPFFLLPELCFGDTPFSLTLVGQYIIKNLVFIMSGVIICIEHKKLPRPLK